MDFQTSKVGSIVDTENKSEDIDISRYMHRQIQLQNL